MDKKVKGPFAKLLDELAPGEPTLNNSLVELNKPIELPPEIEHEILNENPLNLPITEKPQQNKRKTKKTPWKPKKGMSTKNVSLDKLHKKMMTVLGREIDHLMVLSHQRKLEKEDSLALCNYLKLHKQLMKTEEDLSDNITDEELDKILNKKKPKTPPTDSQL